jgi:predicted GNAT family acetyltransferase
MPDATAITPIHHDRAARRFVVVRDGHEAWLDYELAGRTLAITHTIVPAAIGGRGIAGELVRTALEFARAQDLRVRATCSYAEAWMRRHPEFDDLRA